MNNVNFHSHLSMKPKKVKTTLTAVNEKEEEEVNRSILAPFPQPLRLKKVHLHGGLPLALVLRGKIEDPLCYSDDSWRMRKEWL